MVTSKQKILFFTDYNSKKLDKISTRFDKSTSSIHFLTIKKSKFATQKNYPYKFLENFVDEKLIIDGNRERILFMRDISEKLLSNNNFSKEFIFNEINTWWFLTNVIFASLRDKDILNTIRAFENAITNIQPTKILIDSFTEKGKILEALCEKHKIEYKILTPFSIKFKRRIDEIFVKLFTGIKRRFVTKRIASIAKKTPKYKEITNTKKPTIIFISHPRYFRLDYTIEGKLEHHEIYQKNIQLKMKEFGEYDFISLELPTNISEMKFYHKVNKNSLLATPIPIHKYYSYKLNKISRRIRKAVSKKMEKLFNNSNFKEIFSFNKISLIDILHFDLMRKFITVISTGVEHFTLFSEAIEDIQPELIVLHNEQGNYERAFIMALKRKKIPILAIQHGIINSASPGYVLSKGRICKDDENHLKSGCLHIADFTSVYGDKTKEFLIKECGYPDNKVIITGCSRWDILKNKKNFNKKEFLNQLKFNIELPIVSVLSPGLFIKSRQFYFNKTVLETIQNYFPNVQIIWKPHPKEDNNEVKKIAEQFKIKNIEINKDLPLFDVLNASDIVITVHSTTGLEAILFEKAVITFIPEGEEENDLYKDSNAVIKVENQEELKHAINQIFSNIETQEKLQTGRKELIKNFVLFDGQASNRNAKLIKEMLEKNQ
ncbi:MAG: hypothetical protein EAX90_08315 [Candidatus Heimdallarchaeota archaeon]|nr:hypothetical protein [Candidatus Heimdallarchaeota archaeon]